MPSSTWTWLLGAGLGLGAAQACGDASTGEDCTVGSRGCPCTTGGGCDPLLTCIDNVCILFGDDATASQGDTGTNSDPSDPSDPSNPSDPSDATMGTQSTTGGADSSGGGDGPKLDVGGAETGPPGSGCTAIDLLFVLDSSASMQPERTALAATDAFTQIIAALEAINGGGVDYRIGVTDDNDSGFKVPPGWGGAGPWFDSTDLDQDAMALAFNGAVGQINTEPPLGCEHVLTSATDLLLGDGAGFVRPEALLVLVLLTDVDDYGAYDQFGGNDCVIGCNTAPPYNVAEIQTLLSDDVKGGQAGAVAAIIIAGDPTVADGLNSCGQPGSCGCDTGECTIYHADKLYAFAALLGTNGYAADLCLVGNTVPATVETALTEDIDLACMNFEPEG